jgi:hypothetical protein
MALTAGQLSLWAQSLVTTFFIPLGRYISGLVYLFYYSTTAPRYYIRVVVLTLVAYITGQSYVVRLPGGPPRLIARASNVLRTFTLEYEDVEAIYTAVGVHAHNNLERRWRSAWRVRRFIANENPLHQPPTSEFDLRSYQLDGPRWTQGRGLVGHHAHLVLIEEYGRWLDERGVIAGRIYHQESGRLIIGRIPIGFVSAPGVEETINYNDIEITVEWQDIESGMMRGVRATAIAEESDPMDFQETPPLLEMLSE